MKNNRIGFISLIIMLLLMFFFFGRPFLMYAVIVFLVLAVVDCIAMIIDSRRINAVLSVNEVGQHGRTMTYSLDVGSHKGLLMSRNVIVELEIYNRMFGSTSNKTLMFELMEGTSRCDIKIPALECGRLDISCKSIRIIDLFKLFNLKVKPFEKISVVVYPRPTSTYVELSNLIRGESQSEADIQNRKGNDRSETYDIRGYQPGDDIRSIHWKLSEKTDELIVREASEPSHYDLVLIPDIGHYNGDRKVELEELNRSISLVVAIAEQLLQKGCNYTVLIPTETGLESITAANIEDFERLISVAMSFRILEHSGSGLEYFKAENLDRVYTRLLIVSAGRYSESLAGLEKTVGITLVNVVSDRTEMYTENRDSYDIFEIPAEEQENEKYRIIC